MVRNKAKRRTRYPTIPRLPVYYYSTTPVRCLVRQTNPISGRAKGRITADEERSYDELNLERASEKQSQFGRSFKCKVSSVKSGRPGVESRESSYFKLHASHSKLGRRPSVPNKPNPRLRRGDEARGTRDEGQSAQNEANFEDGPGTRSRVYLARGTWRSGFLGQKRG